MPKTTSHATEGDVRVAVDADLKRRYDPLARVVRDSRKKGASAFDSLWEAVGAILEHEPPLYVVAGYKDAGEFFREELGETRRNGFRYVRVAKFASPRDEDRYGTTKLDAALSFIEAKLGKALSHPPLPIAFDRLRIPLRNPDSRGRSSLSLDDARVEDIVAATRRLSKRPPKTTSSSERILSEALRAHPAFSDVHVRVRGGLADITSVPIASWDAFVKALRAVDWPPAPSTGRPSRARRVRHRSS